MAINFPNTPTNGQTYTDAGTGQTWTYELATNSWTASSLAVTGGVVYKGSVDITAAPPTGAKAGEQWSIGTGGTANAGYGPGVTGTITKGGMVMYTGSGWLEVSHSIPDATPLAKGIDTKKWSRTGTVLSPATAGDAVNIGGTKISLKADGTAAFAGDVKAGLYFHDQPSGSPLLPAFVAQLYSQDRFRVRADGEITISNANLGNPGSVRFLVEPNGHLALGNDAAVNPAINLKPDGSAQFASDVKIGGTLPASPNISLKADGSATFAGTVDIGTPNSATTTGARISSAGQLVVNSLAASQKGLIIKALNTEKAVIKADGSATFAGAIRSDTFTGANKVTVFLGSKGTAGDFAFVAYNNATFKPNAAIFADGSATFAGAVTATVTPPSDARFKENITPANPQLADIVALGKQLKNFDWNDKVPLNDELRAVRQLGLIAQEAEKVSPGIVKTIKRTKQGRELTPETVIPAVYKDVVDPQDEENFLQELVTPEQIIPATYEEVDDSFKGISHDALIMKLLGAVAELSAEVEALKAAK